MNKIINKNDKKKKKEKEKRKRSTEDEEEEDILAFLRGEEVVNGEGGNR